MIIGVTGSKGFIGKKLIGELILQRYDVIEYEENLLSWGSFREKPAFEEFKECDLIINLAGKNKGTDEEITKK